MLKNFNLSFKPVSRISTGIEIIIQHDGSYAFRMVLLKNEKQNIAPEILRDNIGSFEELFKLIDPKSPLSITINGKGIIHKKVSVDENETEITLLNKVFPNAVAADFAIQKSSINKEEAFLSIIRVEVLNEILNRLEKNKLTNLVACYLGPFIVGELIPLITNHSTKEADLQVDNFRLSIREQQIIDFKTAVADTEQEFIIGDSRVSQKMLPAFATSLSFFTGNSKGIFNSEILNILKEEYQQKQKFEFRGAILLVATLLVLMVNYFIFSAYWNKSQNLNRELATVENSLIEYEVLQLEYKQKKEFLEQNGLLENSRTSFYIDQLAQNLPASILWTEVKLHPLINKKNASVNDVLYFENKIITIAGNCRSSNELNNWMKKIRKEDWLNKVSMINYKQENAKENGLFLIELKLK